MRAGQTAVLAAVVCLAALLVTSASGSIRSAALRGHIVFTRAGGKYGDETVFYANADGSGQRRLSGLGATCCVRISKDGKRLLVAGQLGNQVTTATMNIDGSGLTKIPLPDSSLNLGPGAWSPDGTQIAFQGWDDSNHARNGIYIANATNGGNLRRLTTDSAYNDLPGDFSPDGTRLAFFRESLTHQSVGSVWVIKLDGSGLRRVSPKALAVGFGTIRWSPDGKNLLFASAHTARDGALWTIHPDGTHLLKVFQRGGRFPISPTWSPTGKQIMFALDPISDEHSHPPNGLYVIDKDGKHMRLVIGGANFKREPDWVR